MDDFQVQGIEQSDLPVRTEQRHTTDVYLPEWAATSFESHELAVLGAIRDDAYSSADGKCSLTVKEIGQRAKVIPKTAARTIGIAIAIGVLEREGRSFINRHIHYKVSEST